MNANRRIYVACLASYNSGDLFGTWINVDGKDADDLERDVWAMLAKSPANTEDQDAEEWAIHDHEGFPEGAVGEFTGLETVATLAEALNEHGKALELILRYYGDLEEALEHLEDGAYQGEYDSLEDWAEQFLEDTGALQDVPENLRNYIDFEAYARDARLGGDVLFIEDGHRSVHVFWAH